MSQSKLFYFFVKTGSHEKMRGLCSFDDAENERISAEATGDGYDSHELDLVGRFIRQPVTFENSNPLEFKFRSAKMAEKYSSIMEWQPFDCLNDDYLVFASSHGSLGYVNKYVAEMKFCNVFIGEIFVQGFKKIGNADYILLEFGTEGE